VREENSEVARASPQNPHCFAVLDQCAPSLFGPTRFVASPRNAFPAPLPEQPATAQIFECIKQVPAPHSVLRPSPARDRCHFPGMAAPRHGHSREGLPQQAGGNLLRGSLEMLSQWTGFLLPPLSRGPVSRECRRFGCVPPQMTPRLAERNSERPCGHPRGFLAQAQRPESPDAIMDWTRRRRGEMIGISQRSPAGESAYASRQKVSSFPRFRRWPPPRDSKSTPAK
jgi:hypothetical protein